MTADACLTNPDPDPELPFQTTSVYPDPANKIGARLYRQLLQNASKMLGTRHSIVYKHVLYVNKQNHPVYYSLEPKEGKEDGVQYFITICTVDFWYIVKVLDVNVLHVNVLHVYVL